MTPPDRFEVPSDLPRDHLLFAALPAPEPRTGVDRNGMSRSLLAVGSGGDEDTLCLDLESGAFVFLSGHDGSVCHVNASLGAFLKCLREFDAGFPYGEADSEPEVYEESAARLTEALAAIDPSAFQEDPGFWCSLMFDVAIGDYAAD